LCAILETSQKMRAKVVGDEAEASVCPIGIN
jgi:hypothetical protein